MNPSGDREQEGSDTGRGAVIRLSRTVIVLGVASLLTDLSSDMIYPLLPAFLAVTLGAGAMGLGVMEGAAETTASLLEVVSGKLADRTAKRKALVVAGYGLSGLARPLIGLAMSSVAVVVLRLLDRVGKGIRTAPRDALIADVTPEPIRGRAYGVHRAMDNAGAVLGPLCAAALLGLGLSTRDVFLAAAVPGAVVLVVLVVGVRETPRTASEHPSDTVLDPQRGAHLGSPLRRLLVVVFVFALANSSDAFLLLRLADVGLSPQQVALAWTAHNVVRTGAVVIGGRLADRVDRRRLVAAGWFLYAGIYAALAFAQSTAGVIACLLVYAIHYGAVEAAERALVADLAPASLRGTAFGWYHATVGVAALPASLAFGLLWTRASPAVAFAVASVVALVALVGLLTVVPRDGATTTES